MRGIFLPETLVSRLMHILTVAWYTDAIDICYYEGPNGETKNKDW